MQGLFSDSNPAHPIGDEIAFKCPPDMLFSHNWNMDPKVSILCGEDGLFVEPKTWPICVIRKLIKVYSCVFTTRKFFQLVVILATTTSTTTEGCEEASCCTSK